MSSDDMEVNGPEIVPDTSGTTDSHDPIAPAHNSSDPIVPPNNEQLSNEQEPANVVSGNNNEEGVSGNDNSEVSTGNDRNQIATRNVNNEGASGNYNGGEASGNNDNNAEENVDINIEFARDMDLEAEEFQRRFYEAIVRRNAGAPESPPEYEEYDEDDNIDLIDEIMEDDASYETGSPSRDDRDFDSDENALLDREEISSVPVFDLQLPTRHSYLGEEMEAISGRTILDGGAETEIPLVLLEFHLVPGQTLPLTVFHSVTQSALLRCVPQNRHFGIVHSGLNDENIRSPLPRRALGTTAEIYEFQEERQGEGGNRLTPSSINIKAKGRHRFNVLSTYRQSDGHLWAKVRIRPEINLPKFWSTFMSSGHRYIFPEQVIRPEDEIPELPLPKTQSTDTDMERDESEDGLKTKAESKCATSSVQKMERRRYKYYGAMTGWPYFVYEQFDADLLVEKIHKKLKKDVSSLASVSSAIPRDPTDLSFWLAQNLTISDHLRLQMLKMDTPIERLRFANRLLDKVNRVVECNQCHLVVAHHGDIFSMSIEGPQGTYVNPHGFVHELITVTKIKGTTYRGLPSTEASWFPGYAWRIIECRVCRNHLGWKFEAVERLKPSKFWGLAKRSVNFKYDFSIENDCPDLDAPPHRTRTESTNSETVGDDRGSRHASESSSTISFI